MTKPWYPHPPVWQWPGLARPIRVRAHALYHETVARVDRHIYDSKNRPLAELRAYPAVIERMESVGMFSSQHVLEFDVARQLRRAVSWRRHDAISARIYAGRWLKGENGEQPVLGQAEVDVIGSPIPEKARGDEYSESDESPKQPSTQQRMRS